MISLLIYFFPTPLPILFYLMCIHNFQGTRIEAYVTHKKLIDRYKSFPAEGEVYHIENFKVVDNSNDYCVTEHPWKLELLPATLIKPAAASVNINGFNFVSIKDISNWVAANIELVGASLFLLHWFEYHWPCYLIKFIF